MNETMRAVGWRRRILATTAFFALVSVACTNFETLTRPEFGFIRVTIVSSGGDLDPDGYHLVVDAQQVILLPSSKTSGSFYVSAGAHAVTLQNIADNCVVKGSSMQTVSVQTNLITDVSFEVDCVATGIVVTARTTGVDTPEVLQLTLVGRPAVAMTSSGSYTIGRLAAGTYVVAVAAPGNCVVSSGGQVSVTVASRAVTPVTFDVTCSKPTRADKIAFVDDAGSPSARYLSVVNPDGTGAARLREGASPSWSSDRTRLAFSTTKCSDDDYYWYYYGPYCTGGIVLLDPETGNVAAASAAYAYEPSWAPTGGALVFEGFGVRERNLKLHVLQFAPGTTTLLDITGPVSNEQPAWSPDGMRIAFVCRWPTTTDLCVVYADGSGLVRLTNDAAADLHPAWNPSGSSIAFARQTGEVADPATGEIVVIDVVTRAVTVLAKGTEPTWSPDGSRLAFAGVDGLFIIDADGTNLKRLTTGFHREPAWRP